MNLLLTGGTGFIGSNVAPILAKEFRVLAPRRDELNLFDPQAVRDYIRERSVEIVVHCANPNPTKNPADKDVSKLDGGLRLFLNLYDARDRYRKMIYIGSGAEYDKTRDVANVREEERFRSLPKNDYGLSKTVMSRLADGSANVYNACVFGCYGKGDYRTKFITHCIRCCREGRPVTIRQDCLFDYIHVLDLGNMLLWMCTHDMRHHVYNASGGEHALLSGIAAEVIRQTGSGAAMEIGKPGLNYEYTANGQRFREESGLCPRISLRKGIQMQIAYETEADDTCR